MVNNCLIYGIHTCKEALNSGGVVVNKVYLLKNNKQDISWLQVINYNCVIYLNRSGFNNLFSTRVVHQGVAMEVTINCNNSLIELKNIDSNYTIAMLDNVTDPHNVGAIIRSAAVFGVKAIIIHNRSSCKISGVVAKTASGGLAHVKIFSVNNLANAIRELKKYGFWIVSLCESGNVYLHEINLKGKICLILGAEGKGIRRLQKEQSDFIVKLPTTSYFSTLNVSATAAISFYEVAHQNGFVINQS